MSTKREHIIINPDGTTERRIVSKAESYASLSRGVDGYIETIPHLSHFEGRRCTAYCNEEGRITGMPFNAPATKLWRTVLALRERTLGPFDPDRAILFGPIVIDRPFKAGKD